jgi:hypothetical protein
LYLVAEIFIIVGENFKKQSFFVQQIILSNKEFKFSFTDVLRLSSSKLLLLFLLSSKKSFFVNILDLNEMKSQLKVFKLIDAAKNMLKILL